MKEVLVPVKKKSIFDIQTEYLELLRELEDNDGLFTEEMEKKYAINLGQLENKLKAYCAIMNQADAHVEAIKKEEARLAKMKVYHINLKDRLKKTVQNAVELYGDSNPKTDTKSIRYDTIYLYTRKGYVLEFEDEDRFDNSKYMGYNIKDRFDYEQIKQINTVIGELSTIIKIDKKSLLSDLKANIEIAGVTYMRKDGLTIK